jgi:hypothetical protein
MQQLRHAVGVVLEMVPLLRLAAGPNPPQGTAAHHSENWYDFSGRSDGPVKGMTSRDSAAVPQFGRFLRAPRTHDLMTRNRRFRFDGGLTGMARKTVAGLIEIAFRARCRCIRIGQYAWRRRPPAEGEPSPKPA